MPYKDPAKRREFNRTWKRRKWAENPTWRQRVLKAHRKWIHNNRVPLGQALAEFRAAGCWSCGVKEPAVLMAHHRDPSQKEFNVGGKVSKGMAVGRYRAELRKCVCLCFNCHALVHAGRLRVPGRPKSRT